MNLSPGVATGSVNTIVYISSFGLRGMYGATRISSLIGARVESIRAPVSTRPALVSFTIRRPSCASIPLERSNLRIDESMGQS
jgi:hypothetical protein